MAIYGAMLSAFPELIGNIEVFTMKPKKGGGYYPRQSYLTVTGYVGRFPKSKIQIEGDNKVENIVAQLFCYDTLPDGVIADGCYLEDNGDILQIIDNNIYAKEGGFSVYFCQVVPGAIDTQTENKDPVKVVVQDY